jgi:hypothetical protein
VAVGKDGGGEKGAQPSPPPFAIGGRSRAAPARGAAPPRPAPPRPTPPYLAAKAAADDARAGGEPLRHRGLELSDPRMFLVDAVVAAADDDGVEVGARLLRRRQLARVGAEHGELVAGALECAAPELRVGGGVQGTGRAVCGGCSRFRPRAERRDEGLHR